MRTVVQLDEETADRWRIVNDGVMGGVSRSRISLDGTVATFEGEVSLGADIARPDRPERLGRYRVERRCLPRHRNRSSRPLTSRESRDRTTNTC